MNTRICNICGVEKDIDMFYPRKDSKTGFRLDCKECVIERQRKRRNLGMARDYDRKRYLDPRRRKQMYANVARWIQRNPKKIIAYNRLNVAIKQGKIVRQKSCQECGKSGIKIQAHHDDYSKPLEIRWLCIDCHAKTRRKE